MDKIENSTYAESFIDRPKKLLQENATLLNHLQVFLGICVSIIILFGLAETRSGNVGEQYRQLGVTLFFLIYIVYQWQQVAIKSQNISNVVARLTKSWVVIAMVLVTAGFVTKTSENFSRIVMVFWFIFSFLSQMIIFLAGIFVTKKIKAYYGKPIKTIIVGSDWIARQLVSSLTENNFTPDRVIGIVDVSSEKYYKDSIPSIPYLGNISEIKNIIERSGAQRLYVALPLAQSKLIEEIYDALHNTTIDIAWSPDIFSLKLLNHSVREINGLPVISLSESPLRNRKHVLTKLLLDKSVSLIMLVFLAPLMLTVACLVKISSSGPVIFRQKRHGQDGKIINVWKFRSMYVHQESKDQITQAKRGDARVTPIGRFIRRTSIDELPQLINVLQGRMSLVGPRPHALQHNELYSNRIKSYMIRHRVKPGMTGLAQIRGFRGETESDGMMLKRVESDIDYINRWSLWLDLKIIILTPFSLFAKNIY